jgi:hypothetical protein
MARKLCGPVTFSSAVPPGVDVGRPPSRPSQRTAPLGMPKPEIANSMDVDRSGDNVAVPSTWAGQLRIGNKTVGPSQPMRIRQSILKCMLASPSAGDATPKRQRQVAAMKDFIRNIPPTRDLIWTRLGSRPQPRLDRGEASSRSRASDMQFELQRLPGNERQRRGPPAKCAFIWGSDAQATSLVTACRTAGTRQARTQSRRHGRARRPGRP